MPSSVIARMIYDSSAALLTIVYVSGAIYAYENVPKETYNAMKAAMSRGAFLNRNIKGKYNFKKIS